MINAEKFEQVFGQEPDRDSCPIGCNLNNPCYEQCRGQGIGYLWWNSEYKWDTE